MIKKGVLLALATAFISGISIFSNSLFVTKTDPLIFALVRNVMVALILTSVLVVTGRVGKLRSLTKGEWGKLGIIGAIGGGIPFAMFFAGLSQIGALNGNIIQKTLFIWVAILAVPFLKERLTKIQLVGYVTLFLGMFAVGGTVNVVAKTGTWLVLGATLLWAIENVIAKVTLRSVPSSVVAWGRMVFGIPFLLAATVILGKTGLLASTATYAPVPILVSSVLLVAYVVTWYTALAHAPATLVSSILVFAPVVTASAAFVVSHKPIAGVQVPSLALLTLGTLLVASRGISWPKKIEVSTPQEVQ